MKSWARCRKFPSESAHRGRLSVDPESSACRKCRLGPIMPCADCETTIPHPQTCQVYKPASSSIFRGFSSSVVFLPLVLFSDAASPVLAIARRKTFSCAPPRVRICRSSRTNPHLELIAMHHGKNRILVVTRQDRKWIYSRKWKPRISSFIMSVETPSNHGRRALMGAPYSTSAR